MLRSNKRVSRHQELLSLLILHPVEGREAAFAMGLKPSELTARQEKILIREIKERINGSNHQG